MASKVIGFLARRAGESCNISHGHLGEVKEILKKLGDNPFGNEAAATAAGVRILLG
jgi:hypothetical protein